MMACSWCRSMASRSSKVILRDIVTPDGFFGKLTILRLTGLSSTDCPAKRLRADSECGHTQQALPRMRRAQRVAIVMIEICGFTPRLVGNTLESAM